MPTPEPRLPGVSTKEAAIRLGVSESTVRRMIEAGELNAEKIQRPGGTLLRVLLDTPQDAPGATPAAPATPEPLSTPEPRQDTSGDITWLREKLDERDQTISGLQAELREETAKRAAAEAHASRLQGELTRERRSWLLKLKGALLGE